MDINYIFNDFDKNTFEDIKLSIYNNPTAVYYISPKSLFDLMEITDQIDPQLKCTFKKIKLLNSICIIKYYNELRIVGFDTKTKKFNLYTLPDNFEYILNKIGITFENINYLNIKNTQLDTIDYFESLTTPENIKWEFDNNNCTIYTFY